MARKSKKASKPFIKPTVETKPEAMKAVPKVEPVVEIVDKPTSMSDADTTVMETSAQIDARVEVGIKDIENDKDYNDVDPINPVIGGGRSRYSTFDPAVKPDVAVHTLQQATGVDLTDLMLSDPETVAMAKQAEMHSVLK